MVTPVTNNQSHFNHDWLNLERSYVNLIRAKVNQDVVKSKKMQNANQHKFFSPLMLKKSVSNVNLTIGGQSFEYTFRTRLQEIPLLVGVEPDRYGILLLYIIE